MSRNIFIKGNGSKSDIFSLNFAKSDILESKLTEIKIMIFLGIKHCQTNISRLYRGNPDLNLRRCKVFMFVYIFLSTKLANIFRFR